MTQPERPKLTDEACRRVAHAMQKFRQDPLIGTTDVVVIMSDGQQLKLLHPANIDIEALLRRALAEVTAGNPIRKEEIPEPS